MQDCGVCSRLTSRSVSWCRWQRWCCRGILPARYKPPSRDGPMLPGTHTHTHTHTHTTNTHTHTPNTYTKVVMISFELMQKWNVGCSVQRSHLTTIQTQKQLTALNAEFGLQQRPAVKKETAALHSLFKARILCSSCTSVIIM